MEDTVKRRLLARGVLAPDNWLNTYINNFRSNDEYAPGQDRLEEYVFKQWLKVNLCELRVGSFPPDLDNQQKVSLNGRYTFQIVSVIDIGHSAYSQHQKVCNVDTENLAVDNETDTFQKKWEPKSSRTLLISITDGTQELVALESKRIPSLSTNLIPGCKAIIKGPVLCRRGFIILEKAEQIILLGGEIESFLIPNAYENILALSLGLPINEKARVATGVASDDLLNEEETSHVERRNTNMRVERRSNTSVPSERTMPRTAVQLNRPSALPMETRQPVTSSKRNFQQLEDDFPDDDALLSIDLDNVMDGEEQNVNNTGSTRSGPMAGLTAGRVHSAEKSRFTIDIPRRPDAFSSRSNIQPSKQPSPPYAIDIDEELLNEFSNDLEEADFSQPVSPPRILDNSERPSSSRTLEKSVKCGRVVGNSGKQSGTIDSWFKRNRTVDLGDPVRTTTNLGTSSSSTANSSKQPNGIFVNSEKRSTHSAPRQGSIHSQDSGFPQDSDIIWVDEDESFVFIKNHQSVDTPNQSGIRQHETRTENARQTEKLCDIVKNISAGKYNLERKEKVKVKIHRVVETLNLKNGEWKIAVQITDGKAVLTVSMSSEVVTKLFGITPAEGAERRKEAITDPLAKQELKMAFQRLENTLKDLDCIFEVVINPSQNRPCVVNIQM